MGRTVDRFAGLATLGIGTAGPLSFSTPELLFAGSLPGAGLRADAGAAVVEAVPSGRPGTRSVRLVRGPSALELAYPIPVPEVSGTAGGAHEAAPRAWVVHAPVPEEELTRLRDARPDLIVLGNARPLFREGEPFVLAVRALREAVGPGPLVWAPRVALPHRLAYLVYAGVDLLDTTEGRLQAVDGTFCDSTLGTMGGEPAARRSGCPCPSCQAEPVGPLADHADWAYVREMALVKAAASEGRLRELVEARLTAEPLLAELLRYTDRTLFPLLDERTPVVSREIRTYVLAESFRRPEVRRFRERFLERYRPPPSKEVLLLVPCSRTKPYRMSRTHRRFARALEGLAGLERVHVVSVTSPLGVVPRDLEDVYPARHYDIPVTGEWSEAERVSVSTAVAHLASTGNYRQVVVHLDPKEYEFLRPTLPHDLPVRWTMENDRSTSAESLDRLAEGVREALGSTRGPVAGGPLKVVREELEAIAAFQFGADAAHRLFAEPCRLAGRPWFQRLTDGRSTDLATWREDRGLFQLTVAGARRMMPDPPLAIEVADGVALAGDLFTPGVVSADPRVRVGDAVVLVRHGELLGVGEAELPGPLMTRLARGCAVHVRHRSRPDPPRASASLHASPEPTRDGPVV